MQNNKTKVALIYDFDETLSTQYMQDFCLIPPSFHPSATRPRSSGPRPTNGRVKTAPTK